MIEIGKHRCSTLAEVDALKEELYKNNTPKIKSWLFYKGFNITAKAAKDALISRGYDKKKVGFIYDIQYNHHTWIGFENSEDAVTFWQIVILGKTIEPRNNFF